jgi:hypothetical protein
VNYDPLIKLVAGYIGRDLKLPRFWSTQREDPVPSYPAEISPWIEGQMQALARRIMHELGVLRKPSLKRLRWTGPVFRDNGSAIYIRIFDNQITPPCDAWTKELKLYKYVVTPVVTVEDHHDYLVLTDRSEYRVYECRVCTGSFHVAKTWMWKPIWI